MAEVALSRFEPDKNRFNTGALPSVDNAVPQQDGWGPLKAPIEVEALYDYVMSPDGLDYILGGDGSRIISGKVYFNTLEDENDAILTDEDALDLYDGTTGGGPIVGDFTLPDTAMGMFSAIRADGTEAIVVGTQQTLQSFNRDQCTFEDVSADTYDASVRWSGDSFGAEIFLQNGTDPEQIFDIETNTVSENTTAPIAKYARTCGSFFVRGNLVGYPRRVQHSGAENPRSNTAKVDLSDYQDMPEGDEVMGIVPLRGGFHVPMRSAIQSMVFTGSSDFVFQRVLIDGSRGTSSPYSICTVGQDDYIIYLDTGWARWRGGGFEPIGEGRVNRWFLSDTTATIRANMVAALDPENNVVWISYTDTDGERKSLGYQHVLDQWTLASGVVFDAAIKARTFAYTESDPPIVEDGALRFAMITGNMTLAYLVGNNLAAMFSSNEYAPFAPDRTLLTRVSLLSDATIYTVTGQTTDKRGGPFRVRDAVSQTETTGTVPLHQDGFTHKLQFNIDEGEDWSTAYGADVEAQKSGRK
jgi:hypothetical protein